MILLSQGYFECGVTAVPRNLTSSTSPVFAGMLLTLPFSGLPLVFCGSLKIIYDLAPLITFRHIKPVSGVRLPRQPVKGGCTTR